VYCHREVIVPAVWPSVVTVSSVQRARVFGLDMPPDAARLMTDDAYYVTENLLALRNTRIGNLLGLCVLTLPTSQPSCGISLMAGPGQDRRLLRLGAAAERALR
jgi:Asp-tRNA(Asn)/Glu-tRNA(Gln) amidotransferase A subunit family amidase